MKAVMRKGLILALLVGIVSLAYLLRATQGFAEDLMPDVAVIAALGVAPGAPQPAADVAIASAVEKTPSARHRAGYHQHRTVRSGLW